MFRAAVRRVATVPLALVLTACGTSSAHRAVDPFRTTTTSPTRATHEPSSTVGSTTTIRPTAAPTTRPTTALSTTPATAPPTFSATATTVTAAQLASTYHAGCPVGPDRLRMLHMSFWGFDNRPHIGAMVVNATVAPPVLTVFSMLFRAHFPIRRMVTVDAYGGDDHASMAADNTSGFNCRPVDGSNPPRWSAHAYGEAIDVNTVENPYVSGSTVLPPAGNAFLDRGTRRPGMAGPGTALNDAFASVGWLWGRRWASPDYQHFSSTGG